MQVSEARDSELVSRRTETSTAKSLGKAAPHVNARGTGDTVNGAVAQGEFTFLSGETYFPGGMLSVSSEIIGRGYRYPMSRYR